MDVFMHGLTSHYRHAFSFYLESHLCLVRFHILSRTHGIHCITGIEDFTCILFFYSLSILYYESLLFASSCSYLVSPCPCVLAPLTSIPSLPYVVTSSLPYINTSMPLCSLYHSMHHVHIHDTVPVALQPTEDPTLPAKTRMYMDSCMALHDIHALHYTNQSHLHPRMHLHMCTDARLYTGGCLLSPLIPKINGPLHLC